MSAATLLATAYVTRKPQNQRARSANSHLAKFGGLRRTTRTFRQNRHGRRSRQAQNEVAMDPSWIQGRLPLTA